MGFNSGFKGLSYRKTLHAVLFFDAMRMLLAEGVITQQENLSINC